MPPAAPLIGALAVGGLGLLTGASIGQVILFTVITVGLGYLEQALQPGPPDFRNFGQRNQNRTATLRQGIVERRLPFGEVILGGAVTFYEATERNRYHHLIVTLGDAPAAPWDGIDIVWLDDTPLFVDQIDSGGDVIDGKYAGKVRIKKHLGGPDQVADSDLISEIERLDADFRGQGVAYLYLKIDWDPQRFPNGLPNVRALCRTNTVLDSRDDVRRWTPNAVLCLREYLTEPDVGLGYLATDLDDSFTDSGANISDEIVDTRPVGHAVVSESADSNELRLAVAGSGSPLRLETGDRVEVFTDGTLPGGLAADTVYYAIVDRLVGAAFDEEGGTTINLSSSDFSGEAATAIEAGNVDLIHGDGIQAAVRLASSYANALARTEIDVSSAGSGQHVLVKTGEPRYAVSGVIETGRRPSELIGEMLSGMSGRLVWTGGTFRILPAAWRAAVLDFDESDLMGPITVRTRRSRRERFNAVRGVFATLLAVGEATDYPPVIDDDYFTDDGSVRIFANIDRPWTSRGSTSQRLGRLDLERHRRETIVNFPTTLKALRVTPGEVITVNNARRGWVSKTFEVQEQSDTEFGDGEARIQGIVMTLAETDSMVFDHDPTANETVKPPGAVPQGGNPLNVALPGIPAITEELYVTRDGAGVKALARVAWSGANDAFVVKYRLQFRRAEENDWSTIGEPPETFFEIRDITPAIYDFRVQAVNQLGVGSDFAMREGVEITGLLAAPADVSGLTVSSIGGLAVLRWTRHPDLDVQIGGSIRFRHAKATSGVNWTGSVSIGDAVPGSETVAVLPLKPGTYLARAFDSSGVQSANATIVLASAGTALNFANIDQLSEHPVFSGGHSGTALADQTLRLDGTLPIDDWPDVDAVDSWDTEGGLATTGTYDFAGGIDQGTKARVRLSASIEALVVNVLDQVDLRESLVDDWADFDGTEGADADAQVWVRETDDDPSASPTFSDWQRLDSAEFFSRAFEFQARLSTTDPAFNIHISELSIDADEVSV